MFPSKMSRAKHPRFGQICQVYGCINYASNPVDDTGNPLQFHKFPNDPEKEVIFSLFCKKLQFRHCWFPHFVHSIVKIRRSGPCVTSFLIDELRKECVLCVQRRDFSAKRRKFNMQKVAFRYFWFELQQVAWKPSCNRATILQRCIAQGDDFIVHRSSWSSQCFPGPSADRMTTSGGCCDKQSDDIIANEFLKIFKPLTLSLSLSLSKNERERRILQVAGGRRPCLEMG